MADKGFFIIFGIILIFSQFLYRMWDKKDNKTIVAAVKSATDSFSPHVETAKRTYGIVKDLKLMHDVRDDDGRPMWYMPKEIIETQRELVKLTGTLAEITNRQLIGIEKAESRFAALIEKVESKCVSSVEKVEDKVDSHSIQCREQFLANVNHK